MGDRFDLAIWLEPEGPSQDDEPGIQVHLNFWKLPQYKALDIGIHFPTMKKGEICLFINTQDSIHVSDISKYFELSDIRNVVFNEFMTVKSCPYDCMCWQTKQRSNSDSKPFCICGIEKTITTTEKYGGKFVQVGVTNSDCKKDDGQKDEAQKDEAQKDESRKDESRKDESQKDESQKWECKCNEEYIRLRLTGDAIESLYNQEEVPSSKLEYYTSKIEFLDFRLNNVRSLPTGFIRDKKSFPRLDKIRCFLMIESSEDLLLYNKTYKKVRAIEKDRWVPYLDMLKSYIDKNKAILAYQWNTDEAELDFSLFTKIKRSEIRRKQCLYFVLVTIGLGMLASLLGTYLDRCLLWLFTNLDRCLLWLFTKIVQCFFLTAGG